MFVVDRGFDPGALLTPLNGHLELLLRASYAAVFELFGGSFFVVRLLSAGGAVIAAALLFVLAKRRVGAAAALPPTLLLLFLGSAWEITMIESGFTHVWCVAAGLGALLALERGDRRGDLLACALLVASIASFSFGVGFAIGAGVWIAQLPDARRRAWIVLVPLALYAAWLAWVRLGYLPDHPGEQTIHLFNILLIPNFAADEASSVAGALSGLNYDFGPSTPFGVFATSSPYGPVLAAAATVGLIVRLRRGPASPFLWGAIAILLAFWIALALGLGAGRSPETVRYVYAGAAIVILIAAEAVRHLRITSGAKLALLAVVVLALCGNVARLRDGARFYRDFAISLRGQLTGIELARGRVDPSYVPTGGSAHFDTIRAGEYLAAVDRNGSPAFTVSELESQSEAARAAADATLVEALGISLSPLAAGERTANCRPVEAQPGTPAELQASPPGLALQSPDAASITIRRFADSTTVSVGELAANAPAALRLTADGADRPWVLEISSPAADVTACDLPASG